MLSRGKSRVVTRKASRTKKREKDLWRSPEMFVNRRWLEGRRIDPRAHKSEQG